MKHIIKKIALWSILFFTLLAIIVFIVDIFIMPAYVKSEEVVVPNLVGKHKDEAGKILTDSNLQTILEGPRYDDRFPVDHVIFQKPEAGSLVKENRRIYIFISGGNPLTKMPNLINKTLRDAKVTIERLGFILDKVSEVKSEETPNSIVAQYPKEGTNLQRGARISLNVSIGPNIGMVRVPDLYGLSLKEARIMLQKNSLILGKINYEVSRDLLPNTVITQYPAKNNLINIGESVDLFITKNIN